MGRPCTWTDDDLRDALHDATSIADVVRRLRLSHGGAAFSTVRTRMEVLGLQLADTEVSSPASKPPAASAPRPRSTRRWSDEQLAAAVGQARSLHQVFTILGLQVGGSQWSVLRARIRHLGLDTAHWRYPLLARSSQRMATCRDRLQAADLQALVERFDTRADLLRSLGIQPTSSSYLALRNALSDAGIPPTTIDGRTGGGRRRRPWTSSWLPDLRGPTPRTCADG